MKGTCKHSNFQHRLPRFRAKGEGELESCGLAKHSTSTLLASAARNELSRWRRNQKQASVLKGWRSEGVSIQTALSQAFPIMNTVSNAETTPVSQPPPPPPPPSHVRAHRRQSLLTRTEQYGHFILNHALFFRIQITHLSTYT